MMQNTDNNTCKINANEEFDFDRWSELYQQDPAAYEAERKALLEAAINEAPAAMQRRLNGLLFEIEARRNDKSTPLEVCMNISGMMWEKFDELRLHLNAIARPESLTDDELAVVQAKSQQTPGTVIPFPRRS